MFPCEASTVLRVHVLQFCSFFIRVSPQSHYLWTPLPKASGQWPAFAS